MRRYKLVYFLLALLCPFYGIANNYVIINQVMYDSPLNEQTQYPPYSNGEYIELYNGSDVSVSLLGWDIAGDGVTEQFNFPDISIAAKSFLIIAFRHAYSSSFDLNEVFSLPNTHDSQLIYQSNVILANQGETIVLHNADHEIVDQITYDGTSNLSKPNRLSADNEGAPSGSQCVSLHRTWVEFDESGKAVVETSQWKSGPVSFYECQLAEPSFGEHYITGNQPLPDEENYIISVSPLDPTSRVSISNTGISVSNGVRALTSMRYYDGLGRPVESINVEASPNKNDLVQVFQYTGLHNLTQQWLPVPMHTDGQYIGVSDVKTKTQSYYSDIRCFGETLYENSALERITGRARQGCSYADRATSNIYDLYDGTDGVDKYTIERDSILTHSSSTYAFSLYKTSVSDEDGKAVITYTDKLGHKVMVERNGKRVYYVYDELERLRYVLPHIPQEKLPYGEFAPNDDILRSSAYYYQYDAHGNMIYKRLPGCEPQYMVYDKTGQLILKQDGNQRLNNKWTLCAYDSLGRNLYTAEIPLQQSHEDLITLFANIWSVEHYGNNPSNKSIPTTGYASTILGKNHLEPLIVNYYDNYDYIAKREPTAIRPQLRFSQESGYGLQHDNAKGLLTGTRIYNLSKEGYTAYAYYYDAKGRIVQKRSIRSADGYKTTTSTEYLFDGSVAQQLMEQGMDNSLVKEYYRYTYDHVGRLLNTFYQLNNDAEIILSSFSYDATGHLVQNLLHNSADSVRYSYDIRNMLTESQNRYFSEKLFYADSLSSFVGATACYNGNIAVSQMLWGDTTNTFAYTYDAMNRLVESRVLKDNQPSLPSEWCQYDSRGNIKKLQRYSGNRLIDDLEYHYNGDGDQLRKVTDQGEDADLYSTIEYHNTYTQADTTMFYDANGNLIRDLDRGIIAIRYNILNLPDTILFANGNQIVNLYDAAGHKYKSIVYTIPATAVTASYDLEHAAFDPDSIEYRVTEYNGNIENYYTSRDTTQRIFNAVGYYFDGSYYHYIKDHLGNICAVVNSTRDSVIQRTLYYASGVPMAQSWGREMQPYLYNGKEFIEAHGLNEYDSQARMYYAPIMRTTTIDPMCESYYHISPYAWCGNNPVKYIDPDGREIKWESKKEEKVYRRYKKTVNSRERKAAKEVASINKKLQKNPRNRAVLLAKLAKAEQKLGTYQQIQCELATMEGSGTIFIIRTSIGEWGSTTQNPATKDVNINITSDDDQAIASVAHELCHGYQYLDGRLDFSEDGEGGGNLYDQTDEIEAYKRQSLFETSLEGMSDEEINSAINKIMSGDEYKDLPVGPLPALIDVRPQILIYNPDDERKPR